MNITIFNRTYTVRRFGAQKVVRGYVTTPHTDFSVSLHVHPGDDSSQTLPEGERRLRHLEGHGTDILIAADQDAGVKGDLLYYHGNWYECVSALEWDHTILNHWNYKFTLVPKDAAGTIDLEDPETEDTGEEESEEGSDEENSDEEDGE